MAIEMVRDRFATDLRMVVSAAGEKVSVRTWADGYGTWHCAFTTTGIAQRDVSIARQAIAYEIACREGASATNYLRVARRYSRTDLPGHRHYAEKGE